MLYMKSHQEYGYLSYYHSEAVANRTSEALLIPNVNRDVSISVTPGTVTGDDLTLQYTASHPDDIKAGTAVWHDLETGPITAPTLVTVEKHVSAIRVTAIGSATIEVYT